MKDDKPTKMSGRLPSPGKIVGSNPPPTFPKPEIMDAKLEVKKSAKEFFCVIKRFEMSDPETILPVGWTPIAIHNGTIIAYKKEDAPALKITITQHTDLSAFADKFENKE